MAIPRAIVRNRNRHGLKFSPYGKDATSYVYCPQQVGTDGQKNLLVFNVKCIDIMLNRNVIITIKIKSLIVILATKNKDLQGLEPTNIEFVH